MWDTQPCVYIMASGLNGTLYVGLTVDLAATVAKHRDGSFGAFCDRYGLTDLVWFEAIPQLEVAIAREKSIKRWRRDWKIALIERDNREWADLGARIGLPPLLG